MASKCYFFSVLMFSLISDESKWRNVISSRRASIFSKKFLFIPLHGSLHFSLALVCNPGTNPVILHLDSLREHASTIMDAGCLLALSHDHASLPYILQVVYTIHPC
jgi:Ulp1 family protease